MEISLGLDPSLPKAGAVEHAIRRAIARGDLAPGARLPATRDLAADFGIARNTVVAAIDDLVAEGMLTTRPRAGVFVARGASAATPANTPAPTGRPKYDLRPGRPEHGSFPAARWLAATRRAALSSATSDGGGAGVLELRIELAAYLSRARGVETTADAIVICAGFRTACTLLAAAFRSLGLTSIAIEDPSLPGIDRPWHTAGLAVVDLDVDDDGADVERLSKYDDAVLLTPSHQFPIGGALSPARRQFVTDWAVANTRFIVEDDYDGEFRFDRRPIAALQRSAPEHVIYAGSASKTLDPGLRLGWLALPPDLVHPVIAASEDLTGGPPILNQLALADFIRTGEYERHIRRQRREYARRRAHLQQALHAAHVFVPGIPAGLHALIPVDEDQENRLGERRARVDDGLAVHTLSRYSRSHSRRSAIVAGFATPPRTQFAPAIETLVDLLKTPGESADSIAPGNI